jgi:hypothetical protein
VRLDNVPIPDEPGAEDRAWRVVRAAYEGRAPARHTRRLPVRALILAGAVLAVVAAAASPPGRAVLGSVRKAIGEEHAAKVLTRLPTGGRLIVESSAGPWLVSPDGSKRLLGDFVDAAWSPHGLYVVATQHDALAAVDPGGHVRWSLSRPAVRFARWGGSRTDTRIAYLSRRHLRVVAGDGTGDRPACGAPVAAAVAPAWRPGPVHLLAYADARHRLVVVNTDGCALAWRSAPIAGLRRLEWSADGRNLLAVSRAGLTLFGVASARPLSTRALPGIAAAAFDPRSHRIGVVRGRDVLLLDGDRLGARARRVFSGAGGFGDLAWSPDGRWLLVAWAGADQWLFLRPGDGGRVRAVGTIAQQFGGGPFPKLGGWCCPAS